MKIVMMKIKERKYTLKITHFLQYQLHGRLLDIKQTLSRSLDIMNGLMKYTRVLSISFLIKENRSLN